MSSTDYYSILQEIDRQETRLIFVI